MADTDATIDSLKTKIDMLKMDRDYWRDQHDRVLQDWRADLESWTLDRAAIMAKQNAFGPALGDLLRFFDPESGVVAARAGLNFLGDAFAKADKIYRAAAAAGYADRAKTSG